MRLLLKSRRRRRVFEEMPMPSNNHKFDDQTGQMFTETTVVMPAQSDINWPYRTDLVALPIPAKRRRGTRSLVAVALETVVRNVSDLTVDVLESVPRRLLQQVWEQVKQRQVIGLHTWRVFSALLREEDNTLRVWRYREQLQTPKSPLHYYAKPLTSTSFEFLAYLSITTAFTVPDLVKLSEMKNVVALEIVNQDAHYQHGVSDRLIRSWSAAARSEGSFQVLRILKLWNFREITTVSLGYLNLFPALAVYDVTGCGLDLRASTQSLAHGWKASVDSNLLERLQAACAKRVNIIGVALGKEVKAAEKAFAWQPSDDSLVTKVPPADVPQFLTRGEITADRANLNRPGKAWDISVYTVMCKIGELRNDTDLVRAGIKIEEQPIVENELICPIPIVSLRLGPTPSWSKSSNCHKLATKIQGLAFTRIKVGVGRNLSSPENQGIAIAQEVSASEHPLKRTRTTIPYPISSGKPAPAKRRATGVARKRQNLDSVLDSFS